MRACTTFRDITPRWWAEQRLRAVNELSRALLAGEPQGTIMGIAAEHARQMVDATHSGVLTVGKNPGSVVVAAANGPGVAHFVGVEYVPARWPAASWKPGSRCRSPTFPAMRPSR